VRYAIYAASLKWNEASIIAQSLVELVPTDPGHWIIFAYAARRKTNGSLAEARTILLKAVSIFPNESTISFNLACYEAQLGNLTKAKEWLKKALASGDKEMIQKMILTDPDLEPLRK
jgi:Flp pilus assembly protein TadD